MGQSPSLPAPDELDAGDRHRVLGGDPTLEAIAEKIRDGSIKKIVIMTGAGISVEAGIPDFRTKGTGLYDNLARFSLPRPEAIFDINYFRYNPEPFYTLIRDMIPGTYLPTVAHMFSVLLQNKGLLLRHYTQNVDSFERLSGVLPDNLVEAHGSFADAHCIECGSQYPIGWLRKSILVDKCISRCIKKIHFRSVEELIGDGEQRCSDKATSDGSSVTRPIENDDSSSHTDDDVSGEREDSDILAEEKVTNRSTKDLTAEITLSDAKKCDDEAEAEKEIKVEENDQNLSKSCTSKENVDGGRAPGVRVMPRVSGSYCGGLIKPDIVFFGECLPDRFKTLSERDLPDADLLIVMGTSLKVHPFSGLVCEAGPFCPRLVINKELVGQYGVDCSLASGGFRFGMNDNYRDVFYEGTCNDGVLALAKMLNWEADLQRLRDEYTNCAPTSVETSHAEDHFAWRRIEMAQPIDERIFIDPVKVNHEV